MTTDSRIPPEQRAQWEELREWMINQLTSMLEEQNNPKMMEETLLARFGPLLDTTGITLPADLRKLLFDEVNDEIVGFGPMGPLLRDDSITEIMVNGPKVTFVERKGKLTEVQLPFKNDDHLLQIIDRIVRPLGRSVDRKNPRVDARLPDGSRVNAIIPPCAIDGPAITIRKFSKKRLQISDLISFGSMTEAMAKFLEACVHAKLNIVVSGGTGSGKTTLLNMLSGYIPEDERIVTIEDSAELQLQQRHVVRLETKPAEQDGSGGPVHIRDLVINSLRMRPERIVVGECRGGEALDMLQAMNTGHDGSMTTTHANSPRECTARLETLCLMSGVDLPVRVVREQIAKAVHLIVQASRLRDGSRKITYITEIAGMEQDIIQTQDVFKYEEKGTDKATGKVIGAHKPMGVRPLCYDKMCIAGYKLPLEMFR